MEPAKLGTPEIVLQVGCEGGSLTLVRASVLAWKENPTLGRHGSDTQGAQAFNVGQPQEVFCIKRNEALLCSLLDEEEQVCLPLENSDYRTTFWDAIADFMTQYSWWMLYPMSVHPRWRDDISLLLEERFPGWRGAPRCWRDEFHYLDQWLEILRPALPLLTMTYLVQRQDTPSQGIRIEILSTVPAEGRCWEVPTHVVVRDGSEWRPDVPGVPIPDEDAARMLEWVETANIPLLFVSGESSVGLTRTFTVTTGNSHFRITWGDCLPIELKHLEWFVEEYLNSWVPMPT